MEVRPMSVGDMIDFVIAILLKRPLLLLGLGLMQSGPMAAFQLAYPLGLTPEEMEDPRNVVIYFVALMAAMLAMMVFYTLTAAIMTQLIASIFLDREFSLRQSTRFALRRFFRLLALSLMVSLIWILLIFPLVLPGFYAILLMVLAAPACVLEDIPAQSAIARSFRLMRWVRAPLRLLGFYCIIMVGAIIVFGPLGYALESHLMPARLNVALQTILNIILGVSINAWMVLFYIDMRIRKEGLDLLLLAQSHAAGGADAAMTRSAVGTA